MPAARMDDSDFGALPCSVNGFASGGGDGGADGDGVGALRPRATGQVIRPELRESGRA